MPLSDLSLWQVIRDWPLPDLPERRWNTRQLRAAKRFEAAISDKSYWTEDSAARLVAEYRRFLYLKALDGGVLTPPACVDEVWHLHLSLGDDLPGRLVPAIGREIRHKAGLTGAESLAAYERTLGLYAREFGDAPADIWPNPRAFRRGQAILRLRWPAVIVFLIMFLAFFALLFFGKANADGWRVVSLICFSTMGGMFAILFLGELLREKRPPQIAGCG